MLYVPHQHEKCYTTIITYEEQTRGWLSYIAKQSSIETQIAAITITNQALLLTRNLEDFRQISELKCEDWII